MASQCELLSVCEYALMIILPDDVIDVGSRSEGKTPRNGNRLRNVQ